MTVYAGLKALHLLCAVLWVGGMFFAYVVLRPSLAAIEAPQRMLLAHPGFPKVLPGDLARHAADHHHRLRHARLYWRHGNAPWQIHAMLGLGLLMAAVFLAIFFGPYRQFRRTTDRNRMASSLDNIRKLIGVNLILGLLTVIVAGLL